MCQKNASKGETAKRVEMQTHFLVCKQKKCANVVYILHGFLFTNGRVIAALARVMNFLHLFFNNFNLKHITPWARKKTFFCIHQTSKVEQGVILLFTDQHQLHGIFLTHLFQCQRFTVNIHKKYNRRLQY